ncbi:MAG: ribonuclease [Acidimicrobiales bacterium]|nr:ribonuclease [Acidimicrobiales bacterium]
MEPVELSELPPEALTTLRLIRDGGPFPYDRDGTTFFNREGILPDEPEGYYAEYTVETPGSPDRGARRIVAGSDGELFYTDDHYDSFREIVA